MTKQKTEKTDTPSLMAKADLKAKAMPHFTLLAKDNFAPLLVRDWIAYAEQNGTPPAKLAEARKILRNIEEWRRLNPTACKTPD